jgi:hypothetical protein
VLWPIYRRQFASVSSSSFVCCLLLLPLDHHLGYRIEIPVLKFTTPHAATLPLSIPTNEINNGVFQAAVDDDDNVGFRGIVFGRIQRVLVVARSWSDSKIDGALYCSVLPFYTSNTDSAAPFYFTGSRKACSCNRRRGKKTLS